MLGRAQGRHLPASGTVHCAASMLDGLRPRMVFPLYERLSGHRPWTELRRLRELQWRTPEELEARTLEKLRPLLNHAHNQVPYYRDLFRQAGLEPGDVRAIADLSNLPITSKADLRARFPTQVVASNLPAKRRRHGSTAGSTGLPFQFYTDRAGSSAHLSSHLFFREWADTRLNDTIVHCPRPAHGSAKQMRLAGLWGLAKRVLLGERSVHLSDFDPSAEELQGHLQRLPPGSPYFIWGYPSYIARVAAQLLESGSALPAYPKVVIAYGETLSLLNASTIAEAFRCRVVNHYSSWEVLHLAQTCPDNPTALHVNSERAILRVIQTNGEPAAPGEVGRVVITDLSNYMMPFINYDLGDWAVAGALCPCGRGFPTLQGLEGRLGEVIHAAAGRIVSPITICRFLRLVARADPYIWEYQAVQTSPERVVFSIVPTPRFSAQFAAKLEADLAGFLGPGMQVDIEAVDRIAVEPSGKRLLVKSHLKLS